MTASLERDEQGSAHLLSNLPLAAQPDSRSAAPDSSNQTLQELQQALEFSNQRYQVLFEKSLVGYFSINAEGLIEDLNSSAAKILGQRRSCLKHSALSAYIEAEDRKLFEAYISRALSGGTVRKELRVVTSDGISKFVLIQMHSLETQYQPDAAACQLSMIDIGKHKATEKQLIEAQSYLQHVMHHDTLTGLPNRLLLNDRLEHALIRARRQGEQVALLFMDLDRFKVINDSLGHQVGDRLICAVGQRIQNVLREEDTLARICGDEFTVILEGVLHKQHIEKVVHKILNELNKPFNFGGLDLVVTSSVGIAVSPQDSKSSQDLIKYADSAMYQAKLAGGNKVHFFTSALKTLFSDRLTIENELREAIECNQLVLHYQPQYGAATETISGFEALVRWQHPVRGLLMPDEFIPVAEETGLIERLDQWVLREACRQIKCWVENSHSDLRVSVNLSAAGLNRTQFIDTVAEILHQAQLPADNLEMELTETSLLSNPGKAMSLLESLRELGVHLSIDDFGTGYSSLNRLRTLPISRLKIDSSFVSGIPFDRADCAIASTIISMGQNLNLEVVSEGVENRAQYEFLKDQKIDIVQGYYFGRPESAREATRLLNGSVEAA